MTEISKKTDFDGISTSQTAIDKDYLTLIEQTAAEFTFEQERATGSIRIPISIFEDGCSAFESIVRFLIDVHHLKYAETAKLLNRKTSTIGVTYRNSKLKSKKDFSKLTLEYSIPVTVFQGQLTIFEALIIWLKAQGHSVKDISQFTKRHYRTIWTVCKRAEQKIADSMTTSRGGAA